MLAKAQMVVDDDEDDEVPHTLGKSLLKVLQHQKQDAEKKQKYDSTLKPKVDELVTEWKTLLPFVDEAMWSRIADCALSCCLRGLGL